MILRYLALVVAFCGLAVAQEKQKEKVHGNIGAENKTAPTSQDNGRTIHYVTVGKATYTFHPNSIQAKKGDIVQFQFFPPNHSVIRAAWGYPCIPYQDLHREGKGFNSGFHYVTNFKDPPIWNLTIEHTEPIFYYCGAPGSCIDWGMVGVINANASTPISTQISLARQMDYQLLPGEPVPNEAQMASMSALAHTATTATVTVTAEKYGPSVSNMYYGHDGGDDNGDNGDEYDHGSGLSKGAIAGIAVGSAAGALILAALFFLLCRTRSLKKKLDQQREQSQMPPEQAMVGPTLFGPGIGSLHSQSRAGSGLPSYRATDEMHTDAMKLQDGEHGGVVRNMSPQLSPYHMQGFQPIDPNHRFTSFTSTSELSGNMPPVVELPGQQQQTTDPQRRFSS